jgi:hypothetical protein
MKQRGVLQLLVSHTKCKLSNYISSHSYNENMRELNKKIIYEGNMEGRVYEGVALQFYQDGPKNDLCQCC